MVLSFLDLVSEDKFFYGFQGSVFILNVFDIIFARELVLFVLVGFLIHFLSKFLFYYVLNYNNTKDKKN
jgi:hypothetical protein